MLPKYLTSVLSVIVVVLCITSTRCDVSHIIGAESPVVDPNILDLLTRNISNYLAELELVGGPQMHLQQIYSASKQTVTGTLYTVDAVLATPDGAKNCKIRVLEKPWIDFCKVSVTCENGGRYEVTFNPHQTSHDISQHLSQATYISPKPSPAPIFYYQQQPQVTYRPNPFVNQLPTTPVVPPHLPLPSFPKLPSQPFQPYKPAPVYQYVAPTLPPYKPQPVPVLQRIVPTLPPYKPQPVTVYRPAPTLPPFQFKPLTTKAPTPFFQPQRYDPLIVPTLPPYKPQPVTVYRPAPTLPPFQYKPQPTKARYDPLIDVREDIHSSPAKFDVPKPLFIRPPELNVLPADQLPQGPALDAYFAQLFNDFMIKYNRQYIDEPNEKAYRFGVFKQNFYTMNKHSQSDKLGKYSVTGFSDLTDAEFGRILGYKNQDLNATDSTSAEIPASGALPEKYDQRDENLVNPVKDQGDCAACWAFVTVGVIEGLCAKKTKKLQQFSEQQLIDCDMKNGGCGGGRPDRAVKYLVQKRGLELESDYPFVYAKSSCKFDPQKVRVKVSTPLVDFTGAGEDAMAKWLYKNGPIMVSINSDPLKYYTTGVLDPTPELCNPKNIDHGVILIGFGVEVDTSTGEKFPYWIARNHWGTSFGENGYFRIIRGKNACGLASYAYSVNLANVENNCMLNGA